MKTWNEKTYSDPVLRSSLMNQSQCVGFQSQVGGSDKPGWVQVKTQEYSRLDHSLLIAAKLCVCRDDRGRWRIVQEDASIEEEVLARGWVRRKDL